MNTHATINIMKHLLALSLVILFMGCTSYTSDIRVKTEVGTHADISDYKSYAWLNPVTTLNDPTGKWQPPGFDIARDIQLLIDRELGKRGLKLNTITPDILVTFQLGANMQALKLKKDPKTQQDTLINTPDTNLIVILINNKNRGIIWISKAQAEIQQERDSELVRKRIDYTITEMFKVLNKKSFF
ncbi:MAG: DUF4136 domain-containing protein [Gammaproteobacteria bacterium]|nr:DUF4136 domain-containing protein [Gammaproteobacteria bacterium]